MNHLASFSRVWMLAPLASRSFARRSEFRLYESCSLIASKKSTIRSISEDPECLQGSQENLVVTSQSCVLSFFRLVISVFCLKYYRFWRLVLCGISIFPISAALAATVQRVDKDFSRIIVLLTSQEMASLELDTPVYFEFGRISEMAGGIITKLNIGKKTALIVLNESLPQIKRNDDLRFLSYFWNPTLSPLHFSLAQYHHIQRSSLETSVSYFEKDILEQVDDETTHKVSRATAIATEAYFLARPEVFGVDLGFERRSIELPGTVTCPDAKSKLTLNQLKPSFWFNAYPHVRISLQYDYTAMKEKCSSKAGSLTYDYSFYEPHLGFVWYGRDFELGLHYKDRDTFKSTDTLRSSNKQSISQSVTRKMPAELHLHGRLVNSPQFIWGGYLGYVFYERTLQEGGVFESKPEIYEMLRLGVNFEHRLTEISKLDWRLAFDGAKVPDFTSFARDINTLGTTVAYYEQFWPELLIGGLAEIAGGLRSDDVDGINPDSGLADKRKRLTDGFQYQIQLMARYIFGVGDNRSRYRRVGTIGSPP